MNFVFSMLRAQVGVAVFAGIGAVTTVVACSSSATNDGSIEAASSAIVTCPKGQKPSRNCVDVCVPNLHADDPCTATMCGSGCAAGFACSIGTCQVGGSVGASCTVPRNGRGSSECSDGHYCAPSSPSAGYGTCQILGRQRSACSAGASSSGGPPPCMEGMQCVPGPNGTGHCERPCVSGDTSCPAGESCTAKGFCSQCAGPADDCRNGACCNGGECLPAKDNPTQFVCRVGAATDCDENNECPIGYLCGKNHSCCVGPGGSCWIGAPGLTCCAGESCVNGACVGSPASGDAGADSGGGGNDAGADSGGGAGTPCTSDSECGGHNRCNPSRHQCSKYCQGSVVGMFCDGLCMLSNDIPQVVQCDGPWCPAGYTCY